MRDCVVELGHPELPNHFVPFQAQILAANTRFAKSSPLQIRKESILDIGTHFGELSTALTGISRLIGGVNSSVRTQSDLQS